MGDLNVVIVGWNNATAHVGTVTNLGNSYQLAVGPTVRTTVATQSIYYAKNIVAAAAGANSVRITFLCLPRSTRTSASSSTAASILRTRSM